MVFVANREALQTQGPGATVERGQTGAGQSANGRREGTQLVGETKGSQKE